MPFSSTGAIDNPATGSHFDAVRETAIVLVAAAVLLVGAVLWAAQEPRIEKTDFTAMYLGARMVDDGLGAKLYDLSEQVKLRRSLFTHAEPLTFDHPPFEALFLAPLGGLRYIPAYLVWAFANALIWLLLPWILRPYLSVPRDSIAYFGLWLLFAPLGVTLYQGQSSLFLLMVFAFVYITLRRGQDFKAGLLLGLGLFKFQFVLPFMAILALRKKWKFVGGFSACVAALGLASWIAVGRRGILNYAHLLASIAGTPQNQLYGHPVDMATVQGFIYALLGRTSSPGTVNLVTAAVSMVLILLVALAWPEGSRDTAKESFDLMFSAALVVSLVTGFHMFTHDLSPMILALLLVAAHLQKTRKSVLKTVEVAALALFWIPPMYFVLLAWHQAYLLVPILLFVGSAAVWTAQRHRIPTGKIHALASE